MVGLRPGRCYTYVKNRAWSRTAKSKASKAFIVGVPDSKIRIFEMGSKAKEKEFDLRADIVIGRDCVVRDNALEASRIVANKYFEREILPENYFFRVRKFPHQVLREHSMLTGAGSDRLSKGMRLSFGTPKGRAARCKAGEALMTLMTFKRFANHAKEGLGRACSKLPGDVRLNFEAAKIAKN